MKINVKQTGRERAREEKKAERGERTEHLSIECCMSQSVLTSTILFLFFSFLFSLFSFCFSSGSNRSESFAFWSINYRNVYQSELLSLMICFFFIVVLGCCRSCLTPMFNSPETDWKKWARSSVFRFSSPSDDFFFFFSKDIYIFVYMYVRWVNILCSLFSLLLERLQLPSLASIFLSFYFLVSPRSSILLNIQINISSSFWLNVRSSYLMCVAG